MRTVDTPSKECCSNNKVKTRGRRDRHLGAPPAVSVVFLVVFGPLFCVPCSVLFLYVYVQKHCFAAPLTCLMLRPPGETHCVQLRIATERVTIHEAMFPSKTSS